MQLLFQPMMDKAKLKILSLDKIMHLKSIKETSKPSLMTWQEKREEDYKNNKKKSLTQTSISKDKNL
jgi:hypothetical protein